MKHTFSLAKEEEGCFLSSGSSLRVPVRATEGKDAMKREEIDDGWSTLALPFYDTIRIG